MQLLVAQHHSGSFPRKRRRGVPSQAERLTTDALDHHLPLTVVDADAFECPARC